MESTKQINMNILSFVPGFILRRCASHAILGVSASLDIDTEMWGVFPGPNGAKVVAHSGERISIYIGPAGIELVVRGRDYSYILNPSDRELLRRSAQRIVDISPIIERRAMA